jgi:hypothetical protein
MQIDNCNLLPHEYVEQFEYMRISSVIQKTLIILALVLLLILSVAVGMCYFMQTNHTLDVPVEIKQSYNAAQQHAAELKKKKDLVANSKAEDCQALVSLNKLLSIKPQDVKFTKVDISKNIVVEGFAKDPAVINQYVSQINTIQAFNKASVDKISSAVNGDIKTFTLKADKK